MTADPHLDTGLARHVWETRYRADAPAESSIEATWRRVAHAVAAPEASEAPSWEARFLDILQDFQFLPGGRIQAGAGTTRDVTLLNCFVMGIIEDSIPGIFRALEEGALTMQRGGGVGYDFSTLRPAGTPARGAGTIASGPVSFMDVWDAMCATIQSTGARRGAMMATLRCDHPDITAFIDAKRRPGRLTHFNLSVQVTDAFLAAVDAGADWPLVFPAPLATAVPRIIPARNIPARIIPARALWDQLLRASYDRGEPGVLFIDRINHLNNLGYCETISATNPCGEVPLPPYGACNLGSINLPRLIRDPFTPSASLDTDRLRQIAATAVRFLDNVLDISRFPLPAQQDSVRRARRLGLGVTGLADALLMLGLRYGDDSALDFSQRVMATICHAAYRQSAAIAHRKGSFPAFDRDRYLAAPFIQALPPDIRDAISRHGMRNSHLLAIAPTGTISLLAGNVSSGMEPIFAADYQRAVLRADGSRGHFPLTDYAVRLWRQLHNRTDGIPDALRTAAQVPPARQIAMQAALQRHVDNSISKTVHIPPDMPFETFAGLFRLAYDSGLKGCTVFRPTVETGAVLSGGSP